MRNETATDSRRNLESESARRPHRSWRTLIVLLLCLVGLNATVRSTRADSPFSSNSAAINTPDKGVASLYPSQIGFIFNQGRITSTRVTLHNISHSFPDDYDILLVGPGGQRAILMSDSGGEHNLNNVTLTFTNAGLPPPLPDDTQIVTGTYRPTNNGGATDTFPPDASQSYSSSLSVFNDINPNGFWQLYVVDDSGGDVGSIANGWTLEFETTAFNNPSAINIPNLGIANPYPSQKTVGGLTGTVRNVRVTLVNADHTYPDDLDILLVGPGGQNAILMSDAGGSDNISSTTIIFDDNAASNLPDDSTIAEGTYRPSNFAGGDSDNFPAPAPAPSGGSALSVFNGIDPNGVWRLYVVDDANNDDGIISTGWFLDFELEPTILANISTRLRVGTGDDVLIGGFIITGTQPKRVIVRAIGPTVPLAGALPDPTLELRDSNGVLVRFNDDWRLASQGFPSQEAEIIATGFAPSSDRESAIIATLPANSASYTAIVRGANKQTGIAVVEGYDLDHLVNSKLANISTRGLVQTGDNVMIAGTIVLGGTTQKVLVRAIGPSLTLAGKLADPTLELRDSNGALIAENDNWNDTQEGDVIATTAPPTNSFESAIVAVLPSNGASYTAIVRGLNGGTGIAVVEIYALN